MIDRNLTENSMLGDKTYETLKGNWGLPIGAFFVATLISTVLGNIPFVAIIMIFMYGPFQLGYAKFSLLIARGLPFEFKDVFSGFDNEWLRTTGLFWRMALHVFLWMLLLIVPGIIAAYSYALSFYLRADYPKLTAKETMEKSKELMDGVKMKLFRIHLRLVLYSLLCVLTLGIGFLWLIPYAHVLLANFYQDVVQDKNFNSQQQIIEDFGKPEELTN